MRKLGFILLITTLITSTAWAGGSIFGGHKTHTSNPDGVSSIGIHICGSLNCPNVILKSGDCGAVEHATVKYGVCVCDEGYVVKGDSCDELTDTLGDATTNVPEPTSCDPANDDNCSDGSVCDESTHICVCPYSGVYIPAGWCCKNGRSYEGADDDYTEESRDCCEFSGHTWDETNYKCN